MKIKYTITDTLEGKTIKQKETILKDKTVTQIFVCLYLCGGSCKRDPTCPWISEGEKIRYDK